MSYQDKVAQECYKDGPVRRAPTYSFVYDMAQEADKEISDLKICQTLTEMNFTNYSEQVSIWLADNRKELEAKDKVIDELKSGIKVIINRLDNDENIRYVNQASNLLNLLLINPKLTSPRELLTNKEK